MYSSKLNGFRVLYLQLDLNVLGNRAEGSSFGKRVHLLTALIRVSM